MQVFKQFTANSITLKSFPFLRELAMEAYLIENEAILQLDNDEFSEVAVLDAEIALRGGRANSDGRIDILAAYGTDYLSIVELKLEELTLEHLQQLEDYLKQRYQILENYPEYWQDSEKIPKWVGILVGKSADNELIEKIKSGYKFNNEIPIGIILLNRFRNQQNNEIIVVSDTYFKSRTSEKDFSKFEFNESAYNKGQLVNAVIKHYVSLNPQISFATLANNFPKHIQGTLGVFATQEEAEKIHERTGFKRYYLKPEKLIQLSDVLIATCTEWNTENISRFIKQSNELGMNIRQLGS